MKCCAALWMRDAASHASERATSPPAMVTEYPNTPCAVTSFLNISTQHTAVNTLFRFPSTCMLSAPTVCVTYESGSGFFAGKAEASNNSIWLYDHTYVNFLW